MTERELKKLSRVELLEMLLALSKENEGLTREVETLRAAQEDRRIFLENAGSIAEAALAINGVFQAAQAAADLYLESVKAQNDAASVKQEPDGESATEKEETCG